MQGVALPLLQVWRSIKREDLLAHKVKCACCGEIVRVVEAKGPYWDSNLRDRWWQVRLSDGSARRLLENHKRVVINSAEFAALN